MITAENYFDAATAQSHMSASQAKRFMECEARAMAEIRGEYVPEKTTSLLVGSFVDAHFAGALEQFKALNPDIHTRTGDLRADYRRALDIIDYLEADPLLLRMMGGEKQRIVTGEIFGVPFRGKIDSLLNAEQVAQIAADYPDMAETLLMADGAIVDLKVMRDMDAVFVPGAGRLSFVQAWHYDLQLAIYQQLVGGHLPCFIVCITKESTPDKVLIHIPQYMLTAALDAARDTILAAHDVKQGLREPLACGNCDYCRQHKTIIAAIDADELDGAGL